MSKNRPKYPPRTMRHWNDDLAVGMAMKTTGPQYGYHEMVELTIALLDHNFDLSREVLPFSLEILPNYPTRAVKQNIFDQPNGGVSQSLAAELFMKWYDRLEIKEVFKDYKKLMLVGYGVSYLWPFLQSWLGTHTYESVFSKKYRDPYQIASYLNDFYAMRSEVEPFSKLTFSYLCSLNKITRIKRDTLQDTVAGVCLYRKMARYNITAACI